MNEMTDTTPVLTPNVIIGNPAVRKVANIVLGIVGLVVATAVVADAASPAFDVSAYTGPVFVVYAYLAGLFDLVVTAPNVPTLKRG